jgi:hypothetical protein
VADSPGPMPAYVPGPVLPPLFVPLFTEPRRKEIFRTSASRSVTKFIRNVEISLVWMMCFVLILTIVAALADWRG